MQFTFGSYRLDVDVEQTRAFYESDRAVRTSESCRCDGCQNYDRAILQAPPTVTDFLRALGIDPQKPGEVFGVTGETESDRRYWYNGWYHVVGTLLQAPVSDDASKTAIYDKKNSYRPDPAFDFDVWFIGDRSRMGWIEKEFPTPIVELSISTRLPWLLDCPPHPDATAITDAAGNILSYTQNDPDTP